MIMVGALCVLKKTIKMFYFFFIWQGFLKALNIIEKNFGSMYFDFGEPISVKDYLGDNLNRIKHARNPSHTQILDKMEINSINNLAHEVRDTKTFIWFESLNKNFNKYKFFPGRLEATAYDCDCAIQSYFILFHLSLFYW